MATDNLQRHTFKEKAFLIYKKQNTGKFKAYGISTDISFHILTSDA